jgi:hypothetical protein
MTVTTSAFYVFYLPLSCWQNKLERFFQTPPNIGVEQAPYTLGNMSARTNTTAYFLPDCQVKENLLMTVSSNALHVFLFATGWLAEVARPLFPGPT